MMEYFIEFVEDVNLTAELTGEPPNEKHLASIHRAAALLAQQMEPDPQKPSGNLIQMKAPQSERSTGNMKKSAEVHFEVA